MVIVVCLICFLIIGLPFVFTDSFGEGLLLSFFMFVVLIRILDWLAGYDQKKRPEEEADAVQEDTISDDVIREDAAAETMKADAVAETMKPHDGVSTGSSTGSSLGIGSGSCYGSSYGSSYASSRPGYLYDDDDYGSYRRRRDNSYDDRESLEAGGLPRHLSPYSDISDPYDRAALEDYDFYDGYDSSSLFGDDD